MYLFTAVVYEFCSSGGDGRLEWDNLVEKIAFSEGLDQTAGALFLLGHYNPPFQNVSTENYQDKAICLELSCSILTMWLTRCTVWCLAEQTDNGDLNVVQEVARRFRSVIEEIQRKEHDAQRGREIVRDLVVKAGLSPFWWGWHSKYFPTGNETDRSAFAKGVK